MIRYPKPALLAQLPPQGGVIEASAGTGKTYTLERLVVDLVLQGLKLEEILVVTFTEKATLEIVQRVRTMLETLASLQETPAETGDCAWELGPPERERLAQALRSFDRAAISTIHGFCRRVLQEGAFEGGGLLRQELADGRTLFGQAFRDLLRTGFAGGPAGALLQEAIGDLGWTLESLENLLYDAQQEEAQLQPDAADLEGLLQRFPADLFDQEAALVADLRGIPSGTIHHSTTRAAAGRVPALLALMASRPSPLRFLSAWDFDKLAGCCAALATGPAATLGAWLAQVQAVQATSAAVLVHALLEPVRARLVAIKSGEGLYDFGDMVLRVRAALRDPERGPGLARRLAQQHKAALIDEFQDTDQAQWEIFRRVFVEQGRPIFVIGDPKQGIYGFRGGDLPTYRAAVASLIGAAEPVRLAENFRSTAALIAAYNHILTLGQPAFFNGENRYPQPVRCGAPDLAFVDAGDRPLAPVRILEVRGQPGKRTWRGIAHTLAVEIRGLVENGAWFGPRAHLEDPERRPKCRLRYRDVQVLVAKGAEGLMAAEALREAGIPCAFYKQDGLFQSEEALDLLDVLRAVASPDDPGRRARALLTPFFGYRPADLEALPALAEDHPAVQRLRAWGELARARAFPQLLDRLLHGSGLAARLRLALQGDRALTNHLHLADLLSSAARERALDLEDLIRLLGRWMDGTALPPGEDGDLQRLEAEPDAVQILTMHQSKGLEAPVVALFGFTGRRRDLRTHRYHEGSSRRLWLGSPPPAIKARIDREEEEEAQRLLYVALTRAQARLLLPCLVADTADGDPIHPRGAYRVLNPVLRAILAAADRPEVFEVGGLARPLDQPPPPAPPLDLSAWVPPELPPPPTLDHDALRAAARPSFTTSFTQMAQQLRARNREAPAASLERHADHDAAAVTVTPGELPRGTRTGHVLHTLLEELDLAEARRAADFRGWWNGGRRAWAEAVLRRFGLGTEWTEAAARLAFAGIRVALPEPDGAVRPLLNHDPGRLLREVDFLSSYFDRRDHLTGALDLLFQRGGRTHVLDWKTNLLPDYGPAALEACVGEHYLLQAKLYTWTVLRWLKVEDAAEYAAKFGGIHYVFLRGLPAAGVWSRRPSWEEALAWRQDLLDLHGELIHG